MLQRNFINKSVSNSTETGTVFINRNLFSNYYLGTLLDSEVRKRQGELGTRMPTSVRRRLVNLWQRVTPALGSNTAFGHTRQVLLDPILTSLGFEPLQEVNENAFSELKGEKLPHGYYLYLPPTPTDSVQKDSASIATDDVEQAPADQLSLLPASLFSNDEEEQPFSEEEKLFFSDTTDQSAVLLSLLRWGQDFDAPFPARIRKSDTPTKLLERMLASGPAQWGILCNGQRMRLMKRMVVSGRQHYFEVDLEALFEGGEEYQFDIFWSLFRAQSYQPASNGRCMLDLVDEGSRNHAMGVSSTLKESVFRAVETLMGALVHRARELVRQESTPEDLETQHRQEIAHNALEDLKGLYEESLILLYRLLFVFYAESRNLLPSDRPVYRDSYSMEPLRDEIEQPNQHYLPNSFRLWETMQSLFRLIHYGCTTSVLIVPAYNGALFNPQRTVKLNALGVPDNAMKEIISHLSQTPPTRERGRERIDYSDLGVEQLGAVYEGLLEFEPHVAKVPMAEVRYKGERVVIPASEGEQRGYQVLRHISAGDFYLGRGAGRKVSGSYYTPQPLVDFLVRRTLEPLVKGRSASEILELKVVDPAMGSGAFLVGACLYLTQEYAQALQREQHVLETALQEQEQSEEYREGDELEDASDKERQQSEELSEEETRPHRRLIAERCLYGVDFNEMAVELAKVSLWLTTLAGDKPLTFLDANLRHGNSLISAPLIPYYNSKGAEYTIERIHPEALKLLAKAHGKRLDRQAGSKKNDEETESLWQQEELKAVVPLLQYRQWIAETPSDNVDLVHRKEQFMQNLEQSDEQYKFRWLCDLWIASWFWRQPPAEDGRKRRVQVTQNNLFELFNNTEKDTTNVAHLPVIDEQENEEHTLPVHYSPLLSGAIYAELISYFKGERKKGTYFDIEPYKIEIKRIIAQVKPFHWELEFPEIFFDEHGKLREHSGFDAILANPPWDLILPNFREFFAAYDPAFRELERVPAEKRQEELLQNAEIASDWDHHVRNMESQMDYLRLSEVYLHQLVEVGGKMAKAHNNTYKMFLERAFDLLNSGGNCGIIVPSGLYTDQGCTGLRQLLLSQAQISHLLCFENRRGIFPIHSSFKFILFGFQKKQASGAFSAAFMLQDLDILSEPEKFSLSIPVELIRRFSPDTLSMMEFRSQRDVDTIARIYSTHPLLGEKIEEGWSVILTSEFDMTYDRGLFNQERIGWPLYEGKVIHQYTHRFSKPSYWVNSIEGQEELARREIRRVEEALDSLLTTHPNTRGTTRQARIATILKSHRRGPLTADDVLTTVGTSRLAFRAIAANTNERTIIAAFLPRYVFASNSIGYLAPWRFNAQQATTQLGNIKSCYTPTLPGQILAYLCGTLNSFVLDYVLRFKVSSNVNKFYVYQLPIPHLTLKDPHCQAIAHRVAQLVCIGPEFDDLRQELLGNVNSPVLPFEQEEARQQVQNEIDALVVHLYKLDQADLEHILFAPYTFPLVARKIKEGVMREFARVEELLREM